MRFATFLGNDNNPKAAKTASGTIGINLVPSEIKIPASGAKTKQNKKIKGIFKCERLMN